MEAENIQLPEKKKDLEGQNEKLAEALRERDSELKDMQDKLAEEMQNSDLRHKIKNKDKEIQKVRQEVYESKNVLSNYCRLMPLYVAVSLNKHIKIFSTQTSAKLRVELVSLIFEQEHSDDEYDDDDDEPALSGDMLRISPVGQGL